MFDLQRLRSLQAVARYGTISAAADALHLTPSAISQQLGKLERETRHTLLERQGRGVRLTAVAELLVDHADRILSLVEQAEADLEAQTGAVHGSLTLAAFATAARDLVPPALRRLGSAHPALHVTLREMEPDQTLPLVTRGILDLAIVVEWTNERLTVDDRLERAWLLDDPADVAVCADHPLADRDWVELRELEGQTWVSWPWGSICHDWLIHTLRSQGAEPRIEHTAMEHATQAALVAAGLGAAILPRLGRGPLPAGVRTVEVRPALERRVCAVWRSDAARRPAIAALVEALRQSARDHAGGDLEPATAAGTATS